MNTSNKLDENLVCPCCGRQYEKEEGVKPGDVCPDETCPDNQEKEILLEIERIEKLMPKDVKGTLVNSLFNYLKDNIADVADTLNDEGYW